MAKGDGTSGWGVHSCLIFTNVGGDPLFFFFFLNDDDDSVDTICCNACFVPTHPSLFLLSTRLVSKGVCIYVYTYTRQKTNMNDFGQFLMSTFHILLTSSSFFCDADMVSKEGSC